MPVFYHEKLPVYKDALSFAIAVDRLVMQLPKERWSLKDQLWRASTSIPFNIAEGTGGQTDGVLIKHFRIARGSAAECSAAFDYMEGVGLAKVDESLYNAVRHLGVQLGNRYFKHIR